MLRHLGPNVYGRNRKTMLYIDKHPMTFTFVERLWLALHIRPDDGPLRWSEDGLTFVLDGEDFREKALNLYKYLMTSANVQSLIRNLYRYGFHISKSAMDPNGEHTGVVHICFHPQFSRQRPALMQMLSPQTYTYMVGVASVLTEKVAAGVEPHVALTECLVEDEEYHYPNEAKGGGCEGGEGAVECLDVKSKQAISTNQTSYQVSLATSGSCCPMEKKRREDLEGLGPEVTFPSVSQPQILGNKEGEQLLSEESPKKWKIGQNTLQFLQKFSIGNRWRPAGTQMSLSPPIQTNRKKKKVPTATLR